VRDLETENGLPTLFELDAHNVTPRAGSDDAERFQRPCQHCNDGVPVLAGGGLPPPCVDIMRRAVLVIVREPEGATDGEMTPEASLGEGIEARAREWGNLFREPRFNHSMECSRTESHVPARRESPAGRAPDRCRWADRVRQRNGESGRQR
jgi:hypothetical protein